MSKKIIATEDRVNEILANSKISYNDLTDKLDYYYLTIIMDNNNYSLEINENGNITTIPLTKHTDQIRYFDYNANYNSTFGIAQDTYSICLEVNIGTQNENENYLTSIFNKCNDAKLFKISYNDNKYSGFTNNCTKVAFTNTHYPGLYFNMGTILIRFKAATSSQTDEPV